MTNQITVVGNLGANPELRFTQTGKRVAGFNVAATPRRKDGEKWVDDGDPLWIKVSVWDDVAEHVANSLTKGDRVVVTGRLKLRKYTTKDGVEGTSLEMTADEVAVSLRFTDAKVLTVERTTSTTAPSGGDPWAAAAPQGDEPPF